MQFKSVFLCVICLLALAATCLATDPLLTQSSLTYMGAFRVPHTGVDPASLALGGTALSYNPASDSLFITGHNTTSSPYSQFAEIYNPVGSLASLAKCIDGSGNVVSCSGYPISNYFRVVNCVANSNPVSCCTGLGTGTCTEPTSVITNLSSATFKQTPVDCTNGNEGNVTYPAQAENVWNTGILVYNGYLVGATKVYYDSSLAQKYSHFVNTLTMSPGNFLGYFKLNAGTLNGWNSSYGGLFPGPMALIPSGYQTQLGGKALTGSAIGSGIVTGTSYGPCTFVFDPDDMTSENLPTYGNLTPTISATALSYYNSAHTLPGGFQGQFQAANSYTSPNDSMWGMVFPDSSRTILYTGSHGESVTDGYSCYGAGVTSLTQAYGDVIPGTMSGTFNWGDTITQASTGATATVANPPDSGIGYVVYKLVVLPSSITGTPDASHTWTDNSTGATISPTAIPTYGCPGGVGNCDVGARIFFNSSHMNCLDLTSPAEGPHSWPGIHYIWAMDVGDQSGNNTSGNSPSNSYCWASGIPWSQCTGKGTGTVTSSTSNNLTAVKLGYIQPYNVVPYATWPVQLPTEGNQSGYIYGNLAGAAWDSAHNLLYMSERSSDCDTNSCYPVIHIYQVGVGYTVSTSGAHATFTPTSQSILSGSAPSSFTGTPDGGYSCIETDNCGTAGAQCGSGTTTYNMSSCSITADCTVVAVCSLILGQSFTIGGGPLTIRPGSGGPLSVVVP